MEKVEFSINHNKIDTYGTEDYNAYYQFEVPPAKKIGYLRNIGQEVPEEGYFTPDPKVDEYRELKFFNRGPQTLKASHPSVELWIPILFDFNKDVASALPNIAIPSGQTDVSITLAPVNMIADSVTYDPQKADVDALFTPPTINICELYVNHIFMIEEVYQIFVKEYGASIFRIHKRQEKLLDINTGSILLNELKFPVETLFIAFRPNSNLSNFEYWYQNSIITKTLVAMPCMINVVANAPADPDLAWNESVWYQRDPSLISLGVDTAGGIQIYETTPVGFYNSYTSWRFGDTWNTPSDLGWHLINFNLKPGQKQPSGHINASRQRELYLLYNAVAASNSNPLRMIIVSRIINILLIKDGSGALYFST